MFSTLANILSVFRMLLSPVFFFLIIAEAAYLRQASLAVFLIAAVTDWYDGEIARRSGTVTNMGKFLDPLADKFLTSSAFLAFAFLDLVPWWMVIVIVIRDFVITVLRSIAESRGVHITTSKFAQWKTFIQMAVLYYLLLLIVGGETGWIHEAAGGVIDTLLEPTLVWLLMFAVTLLTILAGVQYFIDNRRFVAGLITGRKEFAK